MSLSSQRIVLVGPGLGAALVADAGTGLPNRPAALARALLRELHGIDATLVERVRPGRFVRNLAGATPGPRVTSEASPAPRRRVVQHPWPFGLAERIFLRALIRRDLPSLVWVFDPKTASALPGPAARRPLCVFDAYDAWDLSPLVRGLARRRAVVAGYRAAAARADLVFANTAWMQERMQALGARNVQLLPNGSPDVQAGTPAADPYVAYVGRIHERVDVALLTAVADADPRVTVHVAGPVERVPDGWQALATRPNVRLLGPMTPDRARGLIGGARALLVPHVVDDYTRSQDAMKAWDALASGTPVVSTPLSPVIDWPPGMGLTADGPEAFAAAVQRVVAGELDAFREARLEYALTNSWQVRARTALSALEGLGSR